jgi:hypothetical protein
VKPLKEVERTRREYHAKPAVNSVHRSSLLVPEIPGHVAEISFVNHFLLKRGYPEIGLRLTALGPNGRRLESRLHAITEPRVYTFTLTGNFAGDVSGYMAEFFAAQNLFIPFPAVMVNHRAPGVLNTVHAYNRTLNDVFEDDAVNAVHRAEASLDVLGRPGLETVLWFTSGPLDCRGTIELELATESKTWLGSVAVDMPRLTHRLIKLPEALPGLSSDATGVLKVRQPAQPLFYGRMLGGHLDAAGRFTGNHSYYDSSDVAEYWDDACDSARCYPFFQGFDNRLRMYPVMSPSEISVAIELFGAGGRRLGRAEAGSVTSPDVRYLDAGVAQAARKADVKEADVESFAVVASCGSGRMPTRVNHQLVYGRGALESSINISLVNPNTFTPPGKTGLTWGQFPVGQGLHSKLGIVGNDPRGPGGDVEVVFYGEAGELGRISRPLPSGGAALFDSKDLDASWAETRSDVPRYLWYIARTSRSDLAGYVAACDESTGHCTGEHSF